MKIIADTHAHTLASGHAYSTITEMAQAAAKKGLEVLALTEHAPEMPGTCGLYYFQNLYVVPRQQFGIKLLLGAEVNIMDPKGGIDLPDSVCEGLDWVIASIHPPCYGLEHSLDENMCAYEAVMKKPYINVIGHPDDGRFPVDYEELVKMAGKTGTLLELNNSSLSPVSYRKDCRENALRMLSYCKKYQVAVTTGSDAHVNVDAGNFKYVREVLEAAEFPEELVVTTDLEKFHSYMKNKRENQI